MVSFLLEKGANVSALTQDGRCIEDQCSTIEDDDLRIKILSLLKSARKFAQCPCPWQVAFISRGSDYFSIKYPADIVIPDICCSGKMLSESHPAIIAANFLADLYEDIARITRMNQEKEHVTVRLFVSPKEFPNPHESDIYLAYKIHPDTYQLELYLEAARMTYTVLKIIDVAGTGSSQKRLGVLYTKIGDHPTGSN